MPHSLANSVPFIAFIFFLDVSDGSRIFFWCSWLSDYSAQSGILDFCAFH